MFSAKEMDGYRQTFTMCLHYSLYFDQRKIFLYENISKFEGCYFYNALAISTDNLQSTPAVQSQQLISEIFRQTSRPLNADVHCPLIYLVTNKQRSFYQWLCGFLHQHDDSQLFTISSLSHWAHCSISYLWLSLYVQPGGLRLQTLGWSCNIFVWISMWQKILYMDLISN